MMTFFYLGVVLSGALFANASLAPVKLDSPRDTMSSYLEAMNDYVRGVKSDDEDLKIRLDDAVRTLNLEDVPYVLRKEKGREAAILLKEVIDRVIVVDLEKVPEEGSEKNPLLRWRLKGTEIVISRVESGDRKGEYLFTKDTVFRIHDFYEKVKKKPYLSGSGQGAFYSEPLLQRWSPKWAREKTFILANWQWIGLFVSILLGLIVRALATKLHTVVRKALHYTRSTFLGKAVACVGKPVGLIAAAAFWFFSLHALQFEGMTLYLLTVLVQIILSFALIWAAYLLAEVLTEYLNFLSKSTDSPLDDNLVPLVQRALRIFVVIFGVLVMFQNLGVNVMSILAGLGIGGLALALAAKDTFANLFGSVMILLDRPFRVGDWVVIGSVEGTVEEIGFRSTRIRTFYNSLVSVPNSSLANEGIDNMGVRRYRRVKTVLAVTYDTPPEKMESFISGIKEIIESNPTTRKDYYHVVFQDYGDSALQILLYFFFEVPDWAAELRERQNVFMEILKLAKRIGVSFAFPTQSLHIESMPAEFREVKN